jgi:hypothetical protein
MMPANLAHFVSWQDILACGRFDPTGHCPPMIQSNKGSHITCFPEGTSWGRFAALLAAQELPVHEEPTVVLDQQVGVAPYL